MHNWPMGRENYDDLRKKFNIDRIGDAQPEDLYLNFRSDGIIFYCSPDLEAFFGVNLEGQSLRNLFGQDIAAKFITAAVIREEMNLICTLKRTEMKVSVYSEDDHAVLTFEKHKETASGTDEANPAEIITRELANYLSVILSAMQTAKRGLDGTPQFEMLTTAEKNSLRALRLAQNIRDIAAFNSGKMNPKKEYCDLGFLCREISAKVKPHIESRGKIFIEDIGDDNFTVYADRSQITRAIYNLITNAAASSAAWVKLSLRHLDGIICLTVSDNGSGIPLKYMLSLQRESGNTEKSVTDTGGAGYGLLLAKAMTIANGGKISASRREGGGTEISIYLAASEGKDMRLSKPDIFAFNFDPSEIELSVL